MLFIEKIKLTQLLLSQSRLLICQVLKHHLQILKMKRKSIQKQQKQLNLAPNPKERL